MDDADLTNLLREWRYEPGRVNARRIAGRDGRPKLQIRIDLGVLQMEVDGRPDGERPDGFESLLEYQRDRLERRDRGAALGGFVLEADECRALREEALQYYHRSVGLLALGDHAGVVRDAERNLAVFDLCRDFAADESDRAALEQLRPHVIMMRARAEGEAALARGDSREARHAIDRGLAEIGEVYALSGRDAAYERASEVQLLRGLREALVPKLPVSQRMELHERLRAAIDAENYELAALLRDELRLLQE